MFSRCLLSSGGSNWLMGQVHKRVSLVTRSSLLELTAQQLPPCDCSPQLPRVRSKVSQKKRANLSHKKQFLKQVDRIIFTDQVLSTGDGGVFTFSVHLCTLSGMLGGPWSWRWGGYMVHGQVRSGNPQSEESGQMVHGPGRSGEVVHGFGRN